MKVQKLFGIVIMLTTSLLLIMTSCTGGTGNYGYGELSLIIQTAVDDTSISKTIYPENFPVAPDTFAEYELIFTGGPVLRDTITVTSLTPTITLEVGTWTITVKAYDPAEDGSLVAQGTAVDVAVIVSGTSQAIQIHPLQTATGTGDVNLTVTWPDTEAVGSVKGYFNEYGSAETEVTFSDPALTDPADGTYRSTFVSTGGTYGSGDCVLKIKLYDGAGGTGNIMATIVEIVKVYDNWTTEAVIELGAEDF
jgi:hypothetical protein